MTKPSAERPELIALIPPAARRILDVGCGAGDLGAALKRANDSIHVTGIEIDPERAGFAAKKIDRVIRGDAAAVSFPPDSFDCIVYGDSIEHVADPNSMLMKHKEWLAKDGCVAASVPNVQHHSVLRMLLAGRWDQKDSGICDRTHLRFFTRKTIRGLFEECGYRIEILERGRSTLGTVLSLGLFADFFTYQYRLRARPR